MLEVSSYPFVGWITHFGSVLIKDVDEWMILGTDRFAIAFCRISNFAGLIIFCRCLGFLYYSGILILLSQLG